MSTFANLPQHHPHIGIDYKTVGLHAQRIALMGYSHWNGELERADCPDFTKSVIQGVMNGSITPNFFTCIRNYFGFVNHTEFWSKVMFFNYLPRCIGGLDERFATGSLTEHEKDNKRLRQLVDDHPVEKLVVFSSKAWKAMPPFELKINNFDLSGIADAMRPEPCGIYLTGKRVVTAFGLRHPQGAAGDQMRLAIQRIMAFGR